MLSFPRLANLVGYLLLALGIVLANARLMFALDPSRDFLLGRAGLVLAGFSAAIFIVGLVVLSVGWLARHAPSPRRPSAQ